MSTLPAVEIQKRDFPRLMEEVVAQHGYRLSQVKWAVAVRWAVNYVRHALTPYDEMILAARGQGHRAGRAMREVRVAIYEGIARTYPRLAGECSRQHRERR